MTRKKTKRAETPPRPPQAETKAEYSGEFKFDLSDEHGSVTVPWTTVKEIMAAILRRSRRHDQAV